MKAWTKRKAWLGGCGCDKCQELDAAGATCQVGLACGVELLPIHHTGCAKNGCTAKAHIPDDVEFFVYVLEEA